MLFGPKYVFTPAQDAEIRRVYEQRIRGGNKRLALEYGVSFSLISARAAKLGLHPLQRINNRNNPASWKTAELKIIEAHLGLPIIDIRAALAQKGYQRDYASIGRIIRYKRTRREWPSLSDYAVDKGFLLSTDIMAGLGMSRNQLQRWIGKGMLIAERWRGGDGIWAVRRRDLRRALREYAMHWDHRRADKWFLLDLFNDGDDP